MEAVIHISNKTAVYKFLIGCYKYIWIC